MHADVVLYSPLEHDSRTRSTNLFSVLYLLCKRQTDFKQPHITVLDLLNAVDLFVLKFF